MRLSEEKRKIESERDREAKREQNDE